MAQDHRSMIAGWVQPERIILDADIADRAHALRFIAEAIGRGHGLEVEPVCRALERREQAASTGLGNGFALPHARIDGLERPLTLFLRTRQEIAFSAPDGKPVRDILAIMVPADGAKQDHLELLALIARLFADPAFRSQLELAPDPAAAAGYFRAAVARLGG